MAISTGERLPDATLFEVGPDGHQRVSLQDKLRGRKVVIFAVAGALITILYPFSKRFISFPQLVLGVAFAWGVPMAFAAQLEFVPRVGWLLFINTIIWGVIYDTEYAMADRNEDLKIGVKSSAIFFGDLDRIFVGVLQLMFLVGMIRPNGHPRSGLLEPSAEASEEGGQFEGVAHLDVEGYGNASPVFLHEVLGSIFSALGEGLAEFFEEGRSVKINGIGFSDPTKCSCSERGSHDGRKVTCLF